MNSARLTRPFLALRPVGAGAVEHCPGLEVGATGIRFVDKLGRTHDLEREPTLRPKQAAADPRMGGLSADEVRALVAVGDLYPVMRLNRRVILIFDCALTHWRARQLTTRPLRDTPSSHAVA